MRYHYTPIRMIKLKKKKTVTTPNVGEDIQKLNHSLLVRR